MGEPSGLVSTAMASRPGRMTIRGTAILKKPPMIVPFCALERSLADKTRCTTRKSVVQYPKEIAKPHPKTIAAQCMPAGLPPASLIDPHIEM